MNAIWHLLGLRAEGSGVGKRSAIGGTITAIGLRAASVSSDREKALAGLACQGNWLGKRTIACRLKGSGGSGTEDEGVEGEREMALVGLTCEKRPIAVIGGIRLRN